MGTSFKLIKNGNLSDLLSVTLYLYNICQDIKNLEAHDELGLLYFALVDAMGLKKYSEKILDSFVDYYVRKNKLTPVVPGAKYRTPFDAKKLKRNYSEDIDIYDCCGRWHSTNDREANLCRAVFLDVNKNLSQIIALTFFLPEEKFSPENLFPKVKIPKRFTEALEDTSAVDFLGDSLKLSKTELEILLTIYRIQTFKELYMVCNDIYKSEDYSRIEILSNCSGMDTRIICKCLKMGQKLVDYGLVDDAGVMDVNMEDCILEKSLNAFFIDVIKEDKIGKTYSLDSFSVRKERTNIILRMLKSSEPCNILIYGQPGSGKSEYVKALIKESGFKSCVYKNEIEVKGDASDAEGKGLRRLNCFLSVKKEDSILMVDEAENILKTAGSFFGQKFSLPQKGTVNNMLDNSENKAIYILNYTDELDESTLRRFTYSVRFFEMPKKILRNIAEEKINTLKLENGLKNEILDMCGKYRVTGASVENIVKAIKSIKTSEGDYSGENHKQILADIKDVLESNSTLVFGKKKMRDTVSSSYNLDILNTSTPAGEIIEMLENAVAADAEDDSCRKGIRILFHGASGCGKTELARYISERLGRPLLLKRASDILDKYVGESEAKLKAAFDEAEETDSILLFDEADSFIYARDSADKAWERQLVNEFLTQMEEFSGVLICTTNLRKILDSALQRRFHIITEFKPLNLEGVKILLNSYFKDLVFDNSHYEKLQVYKSITPGDFGVIGDKARFISKSKLTADYVVNELVAIQEEKRNNGSAPIGFAS